MATAGKEAGSFAGSGAIDGLECFRFRRARPDFRRHAHEAIGLGVIVEGSGGSEWRGSRAYVGCGQVITLSAEDVHTGFSAGQDPLSYVMLYVQPGLWREHTGSLALPRFDTLELRDEGIAESIIQLAMKSFEGGDLLGADEQLHGILVRIAERTGLHAPAPTTSGSPAVRAVQDHLGTRLDANLRLAELASLVGWTPDHLIRSFRRDTGFTPYEWIIDRRLRRAKSLIASGEPLSDAAHQTGFADQSHLTRLFKAAYGSTPARYARSVRSRSALIDIVQDKERPKGRSCPNEAQRF